MNNLVSIKNLHKHYGSAVALEDISLEIPKGAIVGLLGPNGSGKTTLIKILMGLLSDYQGQIVIDGVAPGEMANKHIAYLPDKSHIPLWFTVSEAVNFFTDFYEDFNKKRAYDMLEVMEIPLKKKIKSLSRGMQEKVGLALVMSRRAKLYVLDEPIGAVDPASRDFIMETILKNYDEESSILLSSHIISDIESVLDRAIFLKQGKIMMDDEVDMIRSENQKSLDELFREVFRNVR